MRFGLSINKSEWMRDKPGANQMWTCVQDDLFYFSNTERAFF